MDDSGKDSAYDARLGRSVDLTLLEKAVRSVRARIGDPDHEYGETWARVSDYEDEDRAHGEAELREMIEREWRRLGEFEEGTVFPWADKFLVWYWWNFALGGE